MSYLRRREFIGLLGAAAAWPLAARAEPFGTPVIGFLCLSSPDAFRPRLTAFRSGLAETGYVEDRNVRIEYRWAEDRAERLPILAADLVGRNVEVIATAGAPAPVRAAKAATASIQSCSPLQAAILSSTDWSRV